MLPWPLRSPFYRHMPLLCGDAFKPRPNPWIAGDVEPALASDVGIGVERDISDRISAANEERIGREMVLHDPDRLESALKPHREACPLFFSSARLDAPPVARNRYIGFVTVLLEEHPLKDLCALKSGARQIGR